MPPEVVAAVRVLLRAEAGRACRRRHELGQATAAAAPGPISTPPRPKSACGTPSARPLTAPSTNSWAALRIG